MRRSIALMVCVGCTATSACDYGNKKETETAKHSLYNTDFAEVYTAAINATKSLYPTFDDSPGPGKIATAWHEVRLASTSEDLGSQATVSASSSSQGTSSGGRSASGASASSGGGGGGAGLGAPTRLATTRMFIRFDVTILGGRPWRVKVVGHAAQWDPGAAMPTELRGLAKPSWLGPRSDALQRAIYTRIKQYAVPMVEEQVHTVEDTLPKPDPNAFKSVPAGAAQTLAAIQVALALRDYGKLRPALAANVVWSEGGGTGRDGALAVWQADPGVLTAMAGVLGSCTSDGERVKCPSAPAENGYQLVLELRQQHWQVVSFLRAE